jgi:DNA-binding beta-propeller fold protein YncE
VLVVPALHRVYATATGANLVAWINEDTGRVLGTTATGAYPDGLAYDPAEHTIWTTNESGGSETIIDAGHRWETGYESTHGGARPPAVSGRAATWSSRPGRRPDS